MNDVLRSALLFRELDDEAASALRASMVEVRLSRGEVLFREGDDGDRIYVVVSGKVKLGRTAPDGRENLLAQFAQRLRRSNDTLADLVFADVPGRVAKQLLDLSERFGVPSAEGVRVVHELTQEELAQLVGASRETVNKALADFVSRNWIRLESRSVVLLDIDRLRRRAR